MPQQPQEIGTPIGATHFGIHRVFVEELFGRYTYDLANNQPNPETSKLMILYGENGSGKTTLLRVIVNLLSHVDHKGHKARVADVKFRHFLIGIGDFRVEAIRDDIEERGFTARVSDDSGVLAEADYYTGEERKTSDERQHKELLKKLQDINVGLFFLADDRRVTSNILSEPDDNPRLDEMYWPESGVRIQHLSHDQSSSRKRKAADKLLEDAVAKVNSWATTKALSGSTQGEEDVNSIYSRIIQQLSRGNRRKRADAKPTVEHLISALQEQHERSLTFSKFGLASPPKLDRLLSSVGKAPNTARDAIAKVLGPYVDSLKARLDALQDVQNSISSFVESINAFYTHKTVAFDLRKGLTIRTREGDSLKPTMLSSGERQLLLLFCNTLMAKDRPSIFIIDEPELSLNVKWQRQLVNSLLSSTRDSLMQFILATHSIELLTRHRRYVVELSETREVLPE